MTDTSVSYRPRRKSESLYLAWQWRASKVTIAQSANQMIAVTENIGTGGFGKYNESGGTNSVTNLNLGIGHIGDGNLQSQRWNTRRHPSIAAGRNRRRCVASLNVSNGTLSATTLTGRHQRHRNL